MIKKYFPVVTLILLLLVGIIALTQELEIFQPENNYELQEEEYLNIIAYDPKMPARWFRSNTGGMALEEIQSRLVALRNEFALSVESAYSDELPWYLFNYYNDEFHIEVRTLYKNTEQIRTQWIFRDINNNTRLNAVFLEIESETNLDYDNEIVKGFIEVYNEDSYLITEYRYFENGSINKNVNEYNNNLLIRTTFSKNDPEAAAEIFNNEYADLYRYNRSLSLRSIERFFYKDMQMSPEEMTRIVFPRRILDSVNDKLFISERLNIYPDFFGDVFVKRNSKMIFETDERGRIHRQTLYDEEDNVIWLVRNTWSNNRIVSTTKTEGETLLLAEYTYNAAGDRITERNLKNGVLERVVRAEGSMEIEELYMNNIVVMRAIWEDGRKISETRIR